MSKPLARSLLILSVTITALGVLSSPASARKLTISQARAVLVGRLNDHADYEYHRDLAKILSTKPMSVAKDEVHKAEWVAERAVRCARSSAERNIYIDLSKIEQVTIQNGNRVHFGCPSGQRCVRVLERNPTGSAWSTAPMRSCPTSFGATSSGRRPSARAQCDPGGKA